MSDSPCRDLKASVACVDDRKKVLMAKGYKAQLGSLAPADRACMVVTSRRLLDGVSYMLSNSDVMGPCKEFRRITVGMVSAAVCSPAGGRPSGASRSVALK